MWITHGAVKDADRWFTGVTDQNTEMVNQRSGNSDDASLGAKVTHTTSPINRSLSGPTTLTKEFVLSAIMQPF